MAFASPGANGGQDVRSDRPAAGDQRLSRNGRRDHPQQARRRFRSAAIFPSRERPAWLGARPPDRGAGAGAPVASAFLPGVPASRAEVSPAVPSASVRSVPGGPDRTGVPRCSRRGPGGSSSGGVAGPGASSRSRSRPQPRAGRKRRARGRDRPGPVRRRQGREFQRQRRGWPASTSAPGRGRTRLLRDPPVARARRRLH